MIEAARQEMIPRLKEIWKNCFHDEDEYIDFYYKERFSQVETLVNTVDGIPAAMVTLVPGKLPTSDATYDLRYIYAVATDPAYQGRGLASELMNEIRERVGTEYDAVFLVPASKGLFDYYAKFGYETVCGKKVVSLSIDELNSWNTAQNSKILDVENKNDLEDLDVQIEPLSASELYEMREQSFRNIGYVQWDVDALDYLIREYELCQGMAVKVRIDEVVGSLFYYYDREHKILYVKETSLSFQQLKPVLKKLTKSYLIERFEVILPTDSKESGSTVPFVMAYGDGISHLYYANFVKD